MTNIPVEAVSAPGDCHAPAGDIDTGNLLPLLHEVRHALARLLEQGEATTIDLRSLPFGPGEEERLEQALGEGEIAVTLNALGPSTITETSIAGVWLVTHRNHNDEVLGKFIEITRIPSILQSQDEDIRDGLDALTTQLDEGRRDDPAPGSA